MLIYNTYKATGKIPHLHWKSGGVPLKDRSKLGISKETVKYTRTLKNKSNMDEKEEQKIS